ncbi:hypothetical protein CkaCkLH20_00243 [Colletotrichum karsti]|uniref:Uncharacterized protein n=1 Tax=Colletotrichum karsti TaxID=1095194 RepID=A0A9P6IF39_9PEZI|nr:uncharacterized protein CkaCkLH20_00243 [Colletotrichum karsti]KAF9882207.1 hypothetical protein CkaCkLH20_00243 [Colletotrichum karsti]
MRSVSSFVAAILLAGGQAAPAVESRQVIYGCYFNGDGIANQYVSVGHDIDAPGKSGKTWHLDCGTTSVPIIKDVFAKCTVDGKQPFGITGVDSAYVFRAPIKTPKLT